MAEETKRFTAYYHAVVIASKDIEADSLEEAAKIAFADRSFPMEEEFGDFRVSYVGVQDNETGWMMEENVG